MSIHVQVADNPIAEAALVLHARLAAVLAEREHVRLAVAGGSALKALAPALEALGPDRARVRLTWVDERCVPLADPDSNRGAAHRLLGGAEAHELPLWLDEETVDGALARVRARLAEDFADTIDVTLLGMGGDGHIASLFVGRAPIEADRVAHVSDSPKPPPRRMTLTRDMLDTAQAHVLLAFGEGKREALSRLLDEDPELPAVGLSGLTLVTDLNDLENTR